MEEQIVGERMGVIAIVTDAARMRAGYEMDEQAHLDSIDELLAEVAALAPTEALAGIVSWGEYYIELWDGFRIQIDLWRAHRIWLGIQQATEWQRAELLNALADLGQQGNYVLMGRYKIVRVVQPGDRG